MVEIPLGLAVVLAVAIIVAYWLVMLAGVWIGRKIALWSIQRAFGTTDPDAILKVVTDKIRGKEKP